MIIAEELVSNASCRISLMFIITPFVEPEATSEIPINRLALVRSNTQKNSFKSMRLKSAKFLKTSPAISAEQICFIELNSGLL